MARTETAPLLVRFTPAEKAAVEEAAAAKSMGLGEFVRAAAMAYVAEERAKGRKRA